MTKLATKRIATIKRESRKSTRTVTVTYSKWPQPVYEFRDVQLEGDIVLEIDIEALLKELGPKALQSKGRRSQECNGAVVVTARVTSSKPGEWSDIRV